MKKILKIWLAALGTVIGIALLVAPLVAITLLTMHWLGLENDDGRITLVIIGGVVLLAPYFAWAIDKGTDVAIEIEEYLED